MRHPIPAALLVLVAILVLAFGSATGAANRARPAAPRTSASRPVATPRADFSDFETGADSNRTWPAGWRRGGNQPTAPIALVAPGHSGARAVLLSSTGRKGQVALVRAVPDSLRPGTVALRLTAWIRTEGADSTAGWLHLLTFGTMISSPDSLVRWPRGTTPWTRYEFMMPVLPDVEHATVGFVLSGGRMWVDDVRIEALDASQVPQSTPRVRTYLDAALDSLCRRTVLTAQLNWGVLQRATRTQMIGGKVPADAYPALRYAVNRLDPDGEVRAPEKEGLVGLAKNFRLLNYFEPDGNVGIIRVPMCDSEDRATQLAFADTTRSVIAGMISKSAHGLMIDLRVVSGGELLPGLAGLGPLLGDGPVLGWLRPDGRRGRWTNHRGLVEAQPAVPPDRTLVTVIAPELDDTSVPVAVLIGPRTYGAGEGLALAFRGRPNTRFFGQPTAGHAYARERVRLDDGAQMRFATGYLTDRAGVRLEGSVMPDDSLNAALLTGGMDSLMIVAMDWLRHPQAARH